MPDVDRSTGAEVVRKTATAPGERERLLREAGVLRTAAGRGVAGLPTVVAYPSAGSTEPCLITAAAAGPSLAAAAPLPVLEVAGVAAEVARILAGLHEAGLVHGAVEPGHVVLDGVGGVILVGLGDGGPAGSPSPDPTNGPLDPADDVAGWSMVVGHLLDRSAPSDGEPLVALRQTIAGRRTRRTGRSTAAARWDQDERQVLAALADQAQDPDPARRPSARSLAAAVTHRVPGARLPGRVAVAPALAGPARGLLDRLSAHAGRSPAGSSDDAVPTWPAPPAGDAGRQTPASTAVGPPHGRRAPRRMERLGVALLGGRRTSRLPAQEPGAAVAGARPTAADDEPSARERPLSAAHAGPRGDRSTIAARLRPLAERHRWGVTAVAATLALLAVAVAVVLRTTDGGNAASPCPPVRQPAADVDGDGCEESVDWSAGMLQAGSARFALGSPGDQWAVGDWDCDGQRTPALLHGGVLAIFDAWPGPGGELRGRQVPADATRLTAVRGADGCDRPSLGKPGAADVVIDVSTVP